ncbi:hypothetical protein M0802_013998 [Mischocyttarus mexicanus]|nr:hypothetical protein M0802_013998 [Mischocyttarus mexicanus]
MLHGKSFVVWNGVCTSALTYQISPQQLDFILVKTFKSSVRVFSAKRINPQQLQFFLVKTLKGRDRVFSAKSEGYLKDKTRLIQDKATTVEVFFGKNIKKLRQGFLSKKFRINQNQLEFFLVQALKVRVRVFSAKSEGFSLRKVKVKSKQKDRKRGIGSKKHLVWFIPGYLKDKTHLIQDKSATVGVFLSKYIKKLRQDFLSEKLRQGKLKDKTRFIQDKSTTVGVFFSKNIKRLRQGFLSEKLRIRHGNTKINQQQLEFFFFFKLKGCDKVYLAKSKGYLKDKTRFIQDKSTTDGVIFSKNIKKLRQDFLSERLRLSQNKVIGSEAKRSKKL